MVKDEEGIEAAKRHADGSRKRGTEGRNGAVEMRTAAKFAICAYGTSKWPGACQGLAAESSRGEAMYILHRLAACASGCCQASTAHCLGEEEAARRKASPT